MRTDRPLAGLTGDRQPGDGRQRGVFVRERLVQIRREQPVAHADRCAGVGRPIEERLPLADDGLHRSR
jgi:hypothetical protein